MNVGHNCTINITEIFLNQHSKTIATYSIVINTMYENHTIVIYYHNMV